MKQKIYIFISMVIFALAGLLFHNQSKLPVGEVRIGGKWIRVDIAERSSTREKGLSGRRALGAGEGMLFVFTERAYHSFWMKDMLFPIDIIWIDGRSIVDIAPNVPSPDGSSDLPVYRPRAAADFVLEVPAGTAARSSWKIGDGVVIKY